MKIYVGHFIGPKDGKKHEKTFFRFDAEIQIFETLRIVDVSNYRLFNHQLFQPPTFQIADFLKLRLAKLPTFKIANVFK